jgi:hypothetical protein
MREALPWLLVAAGAGATVVLGVALAVGALTDRLVLALFIVAFVTDYFDGVVARALGVVTPALRQADSAIDTIFYLVLAAATWKLHRDVLGRHAPALATCLATLGAWYLFDLVRWRRGRRISRLERQAVRGGARPLGGDAVRLRRRRPLADRGLRGWNALAPRGDRDQPRAAPARHRRADGAARGAPARGPRRHEVMRESERAATGCPGRAG